MEFNHKEVKILRYEIIKNYLTELDMKIINEDYDKNKRWFYINVIKQ